MATSKQPKRRRGVVLSAVGWQRLRLAQETFERDNNNGNPYTVEALAELTGLCTNTVGRVRSRQQPVDTKTLATYLKAFGLNLESDDYQSPGFPPPQPNQEQSLSTGFGFETFGEIICTPLAVLYTADSR